MLDQLRSFLNRPLQEADRPRLFALAVVAIIAAGALLALTHDPNPRSGRVRRAVTPPFAGAERGFPASSPASSPTPSLVSEEGRPSASSAGSRADVVDAKRAARRFLAGYLPYSYGHGRPERIGAATTRLRRELAHERPRVPARERRLRPRLVLLQSDAVGHRRAQVLALVGDGARRYTLRLELARAHGSWAVADVGA